MYYAVEFSKNLKKKKIINIKLKGINIILWRDSRGKIIAQSKYCTHLGALLSKGKIINDKLVCPFHGFTFDKKGKSDHCIPNIKNYLAIEKYGFIWVSLEKKELDDIGDFISNIDFSKYEIIPCYKKIYNLPRILVSSNFFDLNHFKHIHGVKITNFKLLNKDKYLHYISYGKYYPYFKFQRFLLKFLPNKVKNEVWFKNNLIFSKHSLLNKKGKVIFEYYGFFPTTDISKDKTLVISSIMVKKGLFSFFIKLYGKRVLEKATDDEFKMLEGGNFNIRNYVDGDELLKTFFNFYNRNK